VGILNTLGNGLSNAFLMAWEVWWALVIGFAISAIVQAWVPRERVERALSGGGARPVALATGLGAASSSCSYAAIAIAKSLFQKGASAASALAFQFASTNLVWELGLVLWVLIGWQFALAEYVGGIVMIGLMWAMLRLFVSRAAEERARAHARSADAGHQHHAAGTDLTWRQRLTSADAWSDVAHNFRGDWQMLWKEITVGFLLAGFIGLLGDDFFNGLFVTDAPGALRTIENVIVLPILVAYRKYYGTGYMLRITALMLVTMILAALAVDLLFGAVGLIPSNHPTRSDVFGSVQVDYKLALNVVATAVFAALFWLTARRGVTDPVCGMKVDRKKAMRLVRGGHTTFFCSGHCRDRFEAEAGHDASDAGAPDDPRPAVRAH
jgi:YHS domain-containing protein